MLTSRRGHAQKPGNFDCQSWRTIPVEYAMSKSPGAEHATAGEAMRVSSVAGIPGAGRTQPPPATRDRQPPPLPAGRREGRLDAMTASDHADRPARPDQLDQPDHVTGLATRGTLEAFLARPDFASPHLALVICDVIGLKQVNEQESFLAGDAVLRAAAERLRREGQGADLLARLGGDELVAVFSGPEAAARAEATVGRLAEHGVIPRLRAGMIVATTGETRESLVNRLYARVRRS
jgi:GGDEF domain-containing protein